MPYRSIILLCFLLTGMAVFAQQPKLKFRHISTVDGLSQNSVFGICKDKKGFMWFATDDGLNRYDGYKFFVYKNDPDDARSLSNNALNDVRTDNAGNLWITSAGGIDMFDFKTETFIRYRCPDSTVVLRHMFLDSKGRLWIGTSSSGLCLFDLTKKTFRFYKHDNNPACISDNNVHSIAEDHDGKIWVGTRRGLNYFDPESNVFKVYSNDPNNDKSIGTGYVRSILRDSRGNIWAGTLGSGIALYNHEDGTFTNFKHNPADPNSIGYNDILCMQEDRKGKIWIGTENGGISIYDPLTKKFTVYANNEYDEHSLSGNSVYSIYKDDVGNMWAGTWGAGLNFLPFFGDKFTTYKKIPNDPSSLSNNSVLTINGDSSGIIWLGTDGGGLNRFDPVAKSFSHFSKSDKTSNSIYSDYVLSVTPYKKNVLALGFHRGGMDFFNVEDRTFTHYDPKDTNTSRHTAPSINIVYKDKANDLWIGANDAAGLYLFDEASKSLTRFTPDQRNPNALHASVIYNMYETRDGNLWIGGDKGLELFDRKTQTFLHYQNDPKNKRTLSNNYVYYILEDVQSNLWLATAAGLNYFNRKTNNFTTYTTKDGLANNVICGILQAKSKELWISTNKGLSRFDPDTKQFRNYDVNDGLQSNTFKSKSCYLAKSGEMYFGGINGFNVFYPDSIEDNTSVPPVYITGFQVFNRPVSIGDSSILKTSIIETKELDLDYNQSVFTLEFSALNYTHPEQNQYAYMLEGFDKDWIFVGNKRSATYTNLNPGTYTFRVKASNNDGIWNENGTSIKIVILPPFWLRWWFIVAVILFAIGVIIGIYFIRLNNIRKQKALLEQKVQEQTEQLVQLNKEERKARLEADRTLQELQIKNKELEQFAYVASHDLQEPLRTTTSFVELLQKNYNQQLDAKANKYLSYISDASIRMRTLIRDLLDFSRIGVKGEYKKADLNAIVKDVLDDIMIAVKESGAVINYGELPVMYGYPTELKQLFQNLLTNSVKFARPGVAPIINITSRELNGYWEFTIQDNGIGIESQFYDRIFKIFQRLHTRDEYEGSGIGLSHCKKIVELHHGKIWVESVLGEGTTFYFTLSSQLS